MRDMTRTTQTLSPAHAEWLETRMIPTELAVREGLWSEGDAIGFTFTMHGEVVYSKFRGVSEKKFWRKPGGTASVPWGFDSLPRVLTSTTGPERDDDDELPPPETLIWVEGEMDRLAQLAAGAQYVLSVPDGARAKEPTMPHGGVDKNYDWLYDDDGNIHPEISQFRNHILAVDGDAPGKILAADLAVRLGRGRCWVVNYNTECKDSNDLLMKHGVGAVTDLIRRAKPIIPSRLTCFGDIPRGQNPVQYSSGFSSMDQHFRLKKPSLVVVTGNPNSGKSQVTTNLVANLARLHGMRTAMLGFEDDVDRVRDDLLAYGESWLARNDRGEGAYVRPDPQTWIDEHFVTIAPSEADEDFTLDWLKKTIEEAVYRHGVECILLDPWNELAHLWERGESENIYIRNALREIKRWARRLQVIMIIVAHPTKSAGASKALEDWDLYAIEGGNSWNTKADHGVIVFRDPDNMARTVIKICKSRNYKTMGVPGAVAYRYDPKSAQYTFLESIPAG